MHKVTYILSQHRKRNLRMVRCCSLSYLDYGLHLHMFSKDCCTYVVLDHTRIIHFWRACSPSCSRVYALTGHLQQYRSCHFSDHLIPQNEHEICIRLQHFNAQLQSHTYAIAWPLFVHHTPIPVCAYPPAPQTCEDAYHSAKHMR